MKNSRPVIFLIGGAGDKRWFGPFRPRKLMAPIVERLYEGIPTLKPTHAVYYLDFREVYKEKAIEKYVLSHLNEQNDQNIYIVGHSFGGWNGAHLSKRLTELGKTVRLLITLDPVGRNRWAATLSSIYHTMPDPASLFWINVSVEPHYEQFELSNLVANLGARWIPQKGPDVGEIIDGEHRAVEEQLMKKLSHGRSAFDILKADVLKSTSST